LLYFKRFPLFLSFSPYTVVSTHFSKIWHIFVTWEDIYLKLYLEGKMNKYDKLSTKALIKLWIELENNKQAFYFITL